MPDTMQPAPPSVYQLQRWWQASVPLIRRLPVPGRHHDGSVCKRCLEVSAGDRTGLAVVVGLQHEGFEHVEATAVGGLGVLGQEADGPSDLQVLGARDVYEDPGSYGEHSR